MKKIFFSTLLFVSLVTSAFASAAHKVDETMRNNFASTYNKATNISWTEKADFTQVDFDLNGKHTSAFYDLSGELVGTTQSISLEELPVKAKRNFAKKYAGATVREAIKFEAANESGYYISMAHENKSEIIKVTESGSVSLFKRM